LNRLLLTLADRVSLDPVDSEPGLRREETLEHDHAE
jgi:hypothetical protein